MFDSPTYSPNNDSSISSSKKKERVTASMLSFFDEEPVCSNSEDEQEYVRQILASFSPNTSPKLERKQGVGIQCDISTDNKIPSEILSSLVSNTSPETEPNKQEVGIQCDKLAENDISWKTFSILVKKCSDTGTDVHKFMNTVIEFFETINDIKKERTLISESFNPPKLTRRSSENNGNIANMKKTPAEFLPSRSGNSIQNSAELLWESFMFLNPSSPVFNEKSRIKIPGIAHERKQRLHLEIGIRRPRRNKIHPLRKYLVNSENTDINNEKCYTKKVRPKSCVNPVSIKQSSRRKQIVPETSLRQSSREKKIPIKRFSEIIELITNKTPKLLKTQEQKQSNVKNRKMDSSIKKKRDTGSGEYHIKVVLPQKAARSLARNWMKPSSQSVQGEKLVNQNRMLTSSRQTNRVRRLYSPTIWLNSQDSEKFAKKRISSNELL